MTTPPKKGAKTAKPTAGADAKTPPSRARSKLSFNTFRELGRSPAAPPEPTPAPPATSDYSLPEMTDAPFREPYPWDEDEPVETGAPADPRPDTGDIDSWIKERLNWEGDSGFSDGRGDGLFIPESPLPGERNKDFSGETRPAETYPEAEARPTETLTPPSPSPAPSPPMGGADEPDADGPLINQLYGSRQPPREALPPEPDPEHAPIDGPFPEPAAAEGQTCDGRPAAPGETALSNPDPWAWPSPGPTVPDPPPTGEPAPHAAADEHEADQSWPDFMEPPSKPEPRPETPRFQPAGPQGGALWMLAPERYPGMLENLRQLKTKLLRSIQEERNNTFLFTGPHPGAGASTMVANLAIVAASDLLDKRILLVDADIQSPSLHGMFGLAPSPGLLNYILNGHDMADIIQNTTIPNLDIVPVGSFGRLASSPFDLKRFEEFLFEAGGAYNMVLIDSAPALRSSHSLVISSKVFQTVIVAEAEKSRWEVLKELNLQLELQGARVMGGILNKRRFVIPKWFYRFI